MKVLILFSVLLLLLCSCRSGNYVPGTTGDPQPQSTDTTQSQSPQDTTFGEGGIVLPDDFFDDCPDDTSDTGTTHAVNDGSSADTEPETTVPSTDPAADPTEPPEVTAGPVELPDDDWN